MAIHVSNQALKIDFIRKRKKISTEHIIEILKNLLCCNRNVDAGQGSIYIEQILRSLAAFDSLWITHCEHQQKLKGEGFLLSPNRTFDSFLVKQNLDDLKHVRVFHQILYLRLSNRFLWLWSWLEWYRVQREGTGLSGGEQINYTVEDLKALSSSMSFYDYGPMREMQKQRTGESFSGNFGNLLKRYQKLNCMVFNVEFPFSIPISNSEQYREALEARLALVAQLYTHIPFLKGLIAARTKILPTGGSCLGLQLILLFDAKLRISSKDVTSQIYDLLKLVALGKEFHIEDWGEILNEKMVQSPVTGEISVSDHRKIDNFKYWVIGFVEKVDEFLNFYYLSFQGKLSTTFIWYREEVFRGSASVSSAVVMDRKRFVDVVLNEQQIWKVAYLEKSAKKRTQISQFFYLHLEKEAFDFSEYKELLERLDVFMVMAMNSTINAFELPIRIGNWIDTPKEIEGSITRVGRQFLWILSHSEKLNFLRGSPYLHHLSLDAQFFLRENNWGVGINHLYTLTSRDGAIALNGLLNELRNNYEANLADSSMGLIKWKKVKASDLRDLHTAVQKDDPTKNVKAISVKKYIHDAYAKCELRQKNIESYVKELKKIDSVIFRINFKLKAVGYDLSQAAFAHKVTNFLLHYRNTTPISWVKGYFGVWRENFRGEPYLDVILIFSADKLIDLSQIEVRVDELWKSYIDKESRTNNIDNEFESFIEVLHLMSFIPELNQKYLLLEIGDKKRWALLSQYLIPYFSYIELFEKPKQYRVPKMLVKGHKLKI